MYELNEQELEQVAGGHKHYVTYGSTGEAAADGSVIFGHAASQAGSQTYVNGNHTVSTAAGQSVACGFGADASSAAATTGSFYQQ
jgi:hypothetical protein